MNVADIEINVIDMECTDRRFGNLTKLKQEVRKWTWKRNRDKKKTYLCPFVPLQFNGNLLQEFLLLFC